MVNKLRGKVVEVFLDSRLVVGQINGEFEARDQWMQGYFSKVRQAQANYEAFTVKQILRGQKSHANLLAMLAISLETRLPRVIIVEDMMMFGHNNQMPSRIHSIQVGPSWMDPLVMFLRSGLLPVDKIEAEKIRRKAPRY